MIKLRPILFFVDVVSVFDGKKVTEKKILRPIQGEICWKNEGIFIYKG